MKYTQENYNSLFILAGLFCGATLPAELLEKTFMRWWKDTFHSKIYYKVSFKDNLFDMRLKELYSDIDPETNELEQAIRQRELQESSIEKGYNKESDLSN